MVHTLLYIPITTHPQLAALSPSKLLQTRATNTNTTQYTCLPHAHSLCTAAYAVLLILLCIQLVSIFVIRPSFAALGFLCESFCGF